MKLTQISNYHTIWTALLDFNFTQNNLPHYEYIIIYQILSSIWPEQSPVRYNIVSPRQSWVFPFSQFHTETSRLLFLSSVLGTATNTNV